MRLFISSIVIVLTFVLTTGRAIADTKLGIRLVQLFDDGVYALEVSYDITAKLNISCIEKCKYDTTFSDTHGLALLGAFGDGDRFITLWSSGSVNWVIIYRIHDGYVTNILEQPSRTLPDFEYALDGRGVIILHNDTPGMYLGKESYGHPPGLTKADREKIRKATTSLWLWNGKTYVPYHGAVLGGWETIK